jgi:aldehyde dehydrogenase (NAD(P)+)
LREAGSGIGTVHNTWMLEQTEKTVVKAPWRPFPRNLLSLNFSLLPRPPWFITNRKQHILGRLLTYFQYSPSIRKLPGVFINALKG